MSRSTLTNTVWGELGVSYLGDRKELRAVCRHCGHVTHQVIGLHDNPFQAVRPQHAPTCKWVAPVASPGDTAPAPVLPLAADRLPVWAVVVVLVALLVLAGLVGHWV